MPEFTKIYLCWRQGQGERRHIVGVLEQTNEQNFVFSYFSDEVNVAMEKGFKPYTEFPDVNRQYNGSSLDIFAQRLTRAERPDVQSFYDFWEIESKFKNDKFYLLGHTQGLLPTDNFEFLADYEPVDGLHFLTELAGLSSIKLSSDSLDTGDKLRFELEDGSKFDPFAVAVFKGSQKVGYIKKIHSRVFHKANSERFKIEVKAVEKNGIIKRAFIKVYLKESSK